MLILINKRTSNMIFGQKSKPYCQTMSPSVRGELTEKMAVDLVSKFIPFILGNTGVDTSVLLGVKMSITAATLT